MFSLSRLGQAGYGLYSLCNISHSIKATGSWYFRGEFRYLSSICMFSCYATKTTSENESVKGSRDRPGLQIHKIPIQWSPNSIGLNTQSVTNKNTLMDTNVNMTQCTGMQTDKHDSCSDQETFTNWLLGSNIASVHHYFSPSLGPLHCRSVPC